MIQRMIYDSLDFQNKLFCDNCDVLEWLNNIEGNFKSSIYVYN